MVIFAKVTANNPKQQVYGTREFEDIVNIDGINYPNLKNLIENLVSTLEKTDQKITKRTLRLRALKNTIDNISMLNPELFRTICKMCIDSSYENITGYNLTCDRIIKLCPKSRQQQIKEKLDRMRRERLQRLESSCILVRLLKTLDC